MRKNKVVASEKYSDRKSLILFSIFIFLFTLIIYLLTAFPSLSPVGDGAELVTNSYLLGINHPPGYPLYSMVGHIFLFLPAGNIPFRLNLMSSFFSSLSSVLIFLSAFLLFKHKVSAIITALTYSFSYTFWKLSACTEVFTLNLFFVISMIYVLLLRRERNGREDNILYIFAFLFGLSLCHHHTVILLFPSFFYLLFTDRQGISYKNILFSFIFFLIGLIPYLYIPLRAGSSPLNWGGTDLHGIIGVISRRGYGSVSLSASGNAGTFTGFLHTMSVYFTSLAGQWTLLFIPLFLFGIFQSFRKDRKIFLFFLLILILSGPFFLLIASPSSEEGWKWLIERFYLPSFLAITFFTGFSIHFITEKIKKLSLSYLLLLLILVPLIYNYGRVNNSTNYLYYDYSKNLLNSLPENSALICKSDLCGMAVMYFQHVEHFREDVKVFHYGLLGSEWYKRQMKDFYPDIFAGSPGRNDIIKMIALKYPLYFDIPPEEFSGHITCCGLVYSFSSDNSHKPEKILTLLEEGYKFRNSLEPCRYNEYFSRELLKFYSTAYYMTGMELEKENLYGDAEKAFTKSLELYKFPQVYNSLGFIYYLREDYKKAMEYYNKALEFKEDFPELYCNMALLYRKEGNLDLAEEFYRKAITCSPDDFEAYFNMALVYLEKGDLDKGEEYFKKSLELNPDNPAVYSNLAVIYDKKGNIEGVITALNRSVELNPSVPELQYNLAVTMIKAGRFKEARILFNKALELGYPEQEISNKLNYIDLYEKSKR
ncbi:MAG: tetratricopeptide repeat protein [Candidatus Eremiobacterota bacterium]